MYIEKRGNLYRIKKTYNNKKYTLTFDHKPTQKEITEEFLKKVNASVTLSNAPKKPFKDCALKYIEVKENVLSASTTRSYRGILDNLPSEFVSMQLDEIDQLVIQKLINDLSANKSAKTVKNYHSFISAVLHMFMPDLNINTTLPQVMKNEDYIPTATEVSAVLKECTIEKYSIVFSLGCNGLRRSEIMALTLDDIFDDYVRVNKAKIKSSDGWVIQDFTKTPESTRNVPISKSLVKRIRKYGCVYDGSPDKILEYLHSCQDKANVPRFKFHSLRHFYATELNQAGFSSKDVQKLGGWSTNSVMERIYQHNRVNQDKEIQKKASKTIENLIKV